jgi:hypothetical protein
MPSFIAGDQEDIYPEWLDKKYDEEEKTTMENLNFQAPLKHNFESE